MTVRSPRAIFKGSTKISTYDWAGAAVTHVSVGVSEADARNLYGRRFGVFADRSAARGGLANSI